MMMYLRFIIFTFLYFECAAMDAEMAIKTKVSVIASDNTIVKIPMVLAAGLAGLKTLPSKDAPTPSYSVASLSSYCPGQQLQQLISYISHPETISHIKNKHELEATTALLVELGAPWDIVQRCQCCADACIAIDVPAPRGGLLDLRKLKVRSCIGLDSFANNQITALNLSENRIRRFDLRYLMRLFPALRSLNCSKNKIDSLRGSMIEGMPAGFTLDMSGNGISRVGKGVVQVLTSLRDRSIRLCLRDTKLSIEQLEDLAGQLEGISCHRGCKQIAMKLGPVALVTLSLGCAMMRGVLLEKDQLPLWGNILLFGGFLLFLGSAIAVIVADSLSDVCLSDDALPSRCEYKNS